MAPTFSHKKFTLIELLVVIAIIGILAGLIVPALQMVKARALMAKCQSNLRQVGIAMKAYGVTFNGVFPHPDADGGGSPYSWYDVLDDKYLSQTDSIVKQCPADQIGNDDGFSALDGQHSYKMNQGSWAGGPLPVDTVWDGNLVFGQYLSDSPPGSRARYFPRESLVKNPGSLVLVFDAKTQVTDPSGTPGVAYWERHDGTVNLLMFDCSVFQYYPPDAHKDSDGTLTTDDPTLHGVIYTFKSKR
ncbi:MAG: type II secretion system protein [Planctomycetota bacterium]